MDCQICELHQKRFYCVNCLRDKLSDIHWVLFRADDEPTLPINLVFSTLFSISRLHDYKNQLAKLAKERDAERERADLLYKSIEGPRIQRAEITQTESRTKELIRETDRLRKANDSGELRAYSPRWQ